MTPEHRRPVQHPRAEHVSAAKRRIGPVDRLPTSINMLCDGANTGKLIVHVRED